MEFGWNRNTITSKKEKDSTLLSLLSVALAYISSYFPSIHHRMRSELFFNMVKTANCAAYDRGLAMALLDINIANDPARRHARLSN